jgi:hypothetical protein
MQVQDVVNAVSSDMRQVLAATAPDAAIIIPWVDRIHKDALHTSLYNYLTRNVTTLSTTLNVSSYSLSGASDGIRRIISVYDRTFDRVLLPYESLGLPSVKQDASAGQPAQIPDALLSATTMTQWPNYYQRLSLASANTLILFPAPQKAAFQGTYEVYYENEVVTVSNLTDPLLIPNDGLDMMVAGVNSLAAAYLKNPEDYQVYKAQYEAMKAGDFKG